MKISQLNLTNFRNHTRYKISLDGNTTLITGRNGAGKTNILEAIHLLSGARSQRTKYDRDLIQFDKTFCTISGDVTKTDDVENLELQIVASPTFENAAVKKAKINKVPKTIAALTGVFSTVLFSPEDINIITGPPSDRRKFLDSVLSVASREYKKALDAYTKALRQRNKLLEQILETGKGRDQLDYWTTQILKDGKYIQESRQKLIDFFNTKINSKISKVNGHKAINYDKNLISEERLDKYSDREVFAKSTLVGPHRDDIKILSDAKDIAEFGSRGQQREAMLGIRMCQIDFFEDAKKEKPVLLLDDIFSEFDKAHREMVMDIIYDYQTIITDTEVPDFMARNIQIIQLA